MEQIEINKGIADMLGWKDKDGDYLLPLALQRNYDYGEWCSTKMNEHGEPLFVIEPCNLLFNSDANWQFFAIDFLNNLRTDKVVNSYVDILHNKVEYFLARKKYKKIFGTDELSQEFITQSYQDSISVTKDKKRTDVIFQVLFKFSEYLKNKDDETIFDTV